MKWKAISRQLRLCAVAFLAALSLAASEHHGIVKFGNVPVPGATVTATKDDKKLVTVTDETGAYSFPNLEDGTWKVQVDMLTFAPQSKDIGVASGLPAAQWDLKMLSMDELKSSLQAAPSPSAAPAATSAPTAGATSPAAAATPATPSLAAAAATVAASQAPKGKGKKGAAPATPQAGFQRADVNASGGGGDVAPTGAASSGPPSIAEAQSSSDAFVVNGSTSNGIERRAIGNGRKGPRSLFTGGLDFRQFDTDIWDARSYSITGQDTPRSPYTHFTAGAQLQGPLWIPHLFHWQGNFFMQYQTTRIRNATNTPYTVPTQAERDGNFQGVANIVDPTTKQPVPNNILPAISAQAKYFLNFFPLPQFTPATPLGYNFEEPVISRSVTDQFSARVNKPLNTKSSLQGLFGMQLSSNTNDNVISWQDVTKVAGYRANLAYTRNFTRTFYGRFFLEYSRYSVRTTPFFATKNTNVSGDAGIEGNDQTPSNFGPPSLGFTNFLGLGDANENFIRNQTPAVGAIVTYIHRPHNFQFGGDFKVQDLSTVGQTNGRGAFSFNGTATAGCYINPANCPAGTTPPAGGAANCATGSAAGSPNCVSGFDFADFLLGIPDVISLNDSVHPDKYLHSNLFDLYVNDNWNVNSSLTLQWGVRWEYSSPFTEKYGRLANLDVAPGFASAESVTPQSPVGPLTGMHYGNSLLRPDRHEISPRISVAWRPIFGSSMVVRAGYGIYYNTSFYQGIASQMATQGQFVKSLSGANLNSSLMMANAFSNAPAGEDTFAVDPNLRVGYTHQYNFSVQQNLTSSLLLTASYSGVKGTRSLQEFQPNTAAPGDTNVTACSPCYTYLASNGNSSRNAGQLQLRRRFHAGLSTNLTYTYAKAIDDSGGLIGYGGQGNGGLSLGAVAQNWLDLAGERGPSNTDQRHLLALTFQYSTGVGVHGGALLSGWRGLILKGWTFQSNINYGSGLPFTPLYYRPLEGSGAGVVRPEYVGGNVYGGPGGLFLNPAAFAAPPAGQFGDVGRNSLYGPNQFSMGGSMARSFEDKYTVTFAATNILNHPVYSSVYGTIDPIVDSSGVVNYGKFGQFLPPGGMRQITATFRWTF